MPFIITQGDITSVKVDAIVNAANSELLPGGGVSGAIHAAAGPELYEECRTLRPLEPGRAVITRGYRLPAGHVIHTVGPVWRGGACGESRVLYSCYKESLALAQAQGLESVAFPLISSGIYGYPPDLAYDVAQRAITGFLRSSDMTVYLILKGKPLSGRFESIRKDIEAGSPGTAPASEDAISRKGLSRRSSRKPLFRKPSQKPLDEMLNEGPPSKTGEEPPVKLDKVPQAMPDEEPPENTRRSRENAPMVLGAAAAGSASFGHEINLSGLEDGFSETLLKMIDSSGLSDPECYRRANIDRKLFSKIRSTPDYHPRKDTVLAFCIALELDEDNAEKLLKSAGYTLSGALKKDAIIRYFIKRGLYDIYEINNVLYDFDQQPLGSF